VVATNAWQKSRPTRAKGSELTAHSIGQIMLEVSKERGFGIPDEKMLDTGLTGDLIRSLTYERVLRHVMEAENEGKETNIIVGTKKLYLSFPISHIRRKAPEKLDEVEQVETELRKRFVVFDPLSITDLADGGGLGPQEIEALRDQTVSRDYLLINRTDFVVVYYPCPKDPRAFWLRCATLNQWARRCTR